MSAVAIRPAEPADVPALLALIGELAVYEGLEDRVVATERCSRSTSSASGRAPRR
jgi:hypothetical protein